MPLHAGPGASSVGKRVAGVKQVWQCSVLLAVWRRYELRLLKLVELFSFADTLADFNAVEQRQPGQQNRVKRPNVRRQGKTLHFKFFCPSISYLSRWRGRGPLHRLQRRAPLRARGAVAPMRGCLLSPLTCKTQTVALQTDTHRCGYATRMWIPPITR